MKRRAVVLFNLGGPLGEGDIRPYLRNFFMDRNIIAAPLPVRYVLSRYIAHVRGRGVARTAYGRIGFRSPLLDNTRAQARALEGELENTRVFTCMRYWHPRADEAAREVRDYDPGGIVLLPLYPQFSTTTTRSAFEDWDRAAKAAGLAAPTRRVCCWPDMPGFVQASAENVRAALADAPAGARILFSAHGLPEKVIRGGDPYRHQCERTASAIAAALGVARDGWRLCFQSRVGPLAWTRPSTQEALEEAARDGKPVVVYPLAFVSEHVETLVEIDMEYRALAQRLGIPWFGRARTVGTHAAFIRGLAGLVADARAGGFCPAAFGQCWRASH